MHLCNSLTQSNSSMSRNNLKADVQLTSQCDNCWSCSIAMDGLTQSQLFKEGPVKCEPIDLSCFVIDLRGLPESTRGIWNIGAPFPNAHPSATANAPLIFNGAPSPQRRPSGWSRICHTPFLNSCLLTFLVMLFICSIAHCVHSLRVETLTWNHNISPTCDLCNANEDEQHSFSLKDLRLGCFSVSSHRFPRCVYFFEPEQQ